MSAWMETAGVTALALAGVALGRWFASLRRPYWLLGYAIPFGLVLLIGGGRLFIRLEFIAPFSWVMAGRTEFALAAIVITMLLTTPLSRLPRRRDRLAVCVLMVVAVLNASVWPFLAPAFNRDFWRRTATRISHDGVCIQRTDYDCGPAAAVTALWYLGLRAEEGELAILAHTSEAVGTPPDVLAGVLQNRFAKDGLVCRYRYFQSLEELRDAGITLAVIRHGFMVDHYVTVLAVRDRDIVVGDPSLGRVRYTMEEFEKKWRRTGIAMHRVKSPSGPMFVGK